MSAPQIAVHIRRHLHGRRDHLRRLQVSLLRAKVYSRRNCIFRRRNHEASRILNGGHRSVERRRRKVEQRMKLATWRRALPGVVRLGEMEAAGKSEKLRGMCSLRRGNPRIRRSPSRRRARLLEDSTNGPAILRTINA